MQLAHSRWWWFGLALALSACGSTRPELEDAPPTVLTEPEPAPEPYRPPPRPVVPAGPPLTVRVIDVGQGDGILIISPTKKAVLIDAGDRGADVAVLAQLAADGITSLDLAVMTHAHADHIGGMREVLAEVPAKLFLDPGFDQPSPIYVDLLVHLEQAKTPVVIARAGRRIDIGGGAYLDVLLPEEPLLGGTRSDVNANSIVLRLVHGQTSMLFTGDAEAATEARLLTNMVNVHADVLKVAHHGSRFSTEDTFLDAVDPRFAIISCGANNRFGHPAPELVDRLAREGVEVWRTDLAGTITLVTDGRAWRITPALAAEAR